MNIVDQIDENEFSNATESIAAQLKMMIESSPEVSKFMDTLESMYNTASMLEACKNCKDCKEEDEDDDTDDDEDEDEE